MRNEDAPEAANTALQLLSHYGQVLLFLARNPGARMRDIADHLGVTERVVVRIVSDLENAGLLSRSRNQDDGRRYQYELHANQPLRHPAEIEFKLASLLKTDE
jgi:DNA-binding MarR family transcriptional regulator